MRVELLSGLTLHHAAKKLFPEREMRTLVRQSEGSGIETGALAVSATTESSALATGAPAVPARE